jgi:sulfatase maturation enzyme AslB (radical SAM superfamily)
MKEPITEMSSNEIYDETIRTIKNYSRCFIRFTGGEPTLYWKELVNVFEMFANNTRTIEIPILIQTNGILIGKKKINLNDLNRDPIKKLKFLFELSFKGTNQSEFETLTQNSGQLYEYQLAAYEYFKIAQKKNLNISFITVLGIYHSAIKSHHSKYAFVYSSDDKIMFDKHKPWHPEFERIWTESRRKWVESLRMSPKGVWETLWKRCGDKGAGILKKFTEGAKTNPGSIFPSKPRGYEYSKSIVENEYW